MSRQSKIEQAKKKFEGENLSEADIAQRIKDNAPTSPILEKWTKETLECPACGQEALDKYTGGPDIESGPEGTEINYTDFIYHCRVCDLNLTAEEYGD